MNPISDKYRTNYKKSASQIPERPIFVIRLGFEPKTHSLEGCCSIQLSYRTFPRKMRIAKIIIIIDYFESAEKSDELNAGFVAFSPHFFGPDTALDFSDVGFSQQEHTESRLTDTSADGVWELVLEEHLVEHQFFLVFLTLELELGP